MKSSFTCIYRIVWNCLLKVNNIKGFHVDRQIDICLNTKGKLFFQNTVCGKSKQEEEGDLGIDIWITKMMVMVINTIINIINDENA